MPEPAATSTGPQSPLVDAQHPWLGLLPFKEVHRAFFFGRDDEITELLGRIRENSLTILFGQSGLGKTSLLGAAVVPLLREAAFAPVLVRLDYAVGAPSLLEQTRAAFRTATPGAAWPEDAAATPLWELFHRSPGLLPPGSPAPLLIFDQFEEIFTLARQNPAREHEAEEWLEQMADLLQNRPPRTLEDRFAENRRLARDFEFGSSPLRVVFALREDYLSHLEGWKTRLPLLTQNRMALLRLNGLQALDAVLGPASLGERPLISREVAAGIVRTVARVEPATPQPQIRAVPPLLSLLCEQLNAARLAAGAAEITAGMVTGQSQDILQRFYVESYAAFPSEHREAIRALIEDPPMITEGGYRNSLVREDAEAQLARLGVADPRGVFDALIQRRLITGEEREGVQRLEVTHDVLVPLLVRSRKERRERVARELAEREKREAEARAEEQRRQVRKARRTTAILSALSILAVIAMTAAIRATLDAKREAITTEEAIRRTLHTLDEASMADYAVAIQRLEKDGKWHEGLAHLVRALKWEPGNSLAAARLYSTLSYYAPQKQNWPRYTLSHGGTVWSAQFSPDGSRILTASEDTTARIWDAATGQPVGEPLPHKGRVWSARFSPDGSRILTESQDGITRVWDTATVKRLSELPLPKDRRNDAEYSSDGTRFVTVIDDVGQVWDAATGQPLGEPLHHVREVGSAHLSPDGSRVLTVSADITADIENKTAQVWDAVTGKPLGSPMCHAAQIKSAEFSPDGTLVVTTSADKTAQVWGAETGQAIGEPLRHEGEVRHAHFSPDGARVVTASKDKTARVWDAVSGEPLGEPLRHEDDVLSAEFSPDGSLIVTASADQTARVWDAALQNPLSDPLGDPLHHRGRVTTAQFSADSSRIVTSCNGYGYFTAWVWAAASLSPVGEPLRHRGDVVAAQFSPDGARIVTASSRTARVWDAASGQPLGDPLLHEGDVNSAQFSPNGSRIVTASSDKTARVWDVATSKPLGDPLRHEGGVNSAQFSPDGSRVVTASADKTARVWDAATSKSLGGPLRHEDGVNSAQFSPDGSHMVTASADKTARVWDAATGQPLGGPLRHEGEVWSAQFSPDGSHIVTASFDQTARAWDATTGQPLGAPLHHSASVASAQFSPDGSLIVTASNDHTARVWVVATGQPLGEPLRHEYDVNSARFSPDGTRIVTASGDRTARIWDVTKLTRLPLPVPEWMRERASALAGLRFTEDGELQPISTGDRLSVLHEAAPGADVWAVLARWLVQPAAERTVNPYSRSTRRQFAERERDTLASTGLEAALHCDPTVPLARLLLAGFEKDPQRAAFLRDYDLQRMPDEAGLWERAVRALAAQKDEARARRALEKLGKLAPEQVAKVRKELGL